MNLRAVPPRQDLEALDALEAAVPDASAIAPGQEIEAIAAIGALVARLGGLQAALAARSLAQVARNGDDGDRLLSVVEAAARLNVSESWLQHRSRKLPFVVRTEGRVSYSSRGIDRYIAQRKGR